MDWLVQLQGKVVGLDIAPLIYFMERHPKYYQSTDHFFRALNRGDFRAVTSTITLTEVLVHPLRLGNTELARQYRTILTNSPELSIFPISIEVAEIAANLRASHNLRTPDAIQIATAIQQKSSFFLTNDVNLSILSQHVDLDVLVLDKIIG